MQNYGIVSNPNYGVVSDPNYGVVSNQPVSTGPPGQYPVNGVTVRPLRDTPEDAAFAGRVMVEAFKDKFAHSVTKEKLPIATNVMIPYYQNQYPLFYARNFVAELNGRLVGYIGIKFKGDRFKDQGGDICELGCWHACRFMCFSWFMDFEVKERKKCLLEIIGVDEFARGKGVGKLLMDRAEYEAKREGSTHIYLMVITTNRAINLYERQGYTRKETHNSCCFKCVAGPPGPEDDGHDTESIVTSPHRRRRLHDTEGIHVAYFPQKPGNIDYSTGDLNQRIGDMFTMINNN